MIVCDAASPLPEGTGHIMSMAFLASEFRNMDLTRKSILFLTPSPRGASAIRVAAATGTAAPSAPTPPTGVLSVTVVSVDTPSSSEDW